MRVYASAEMTLTDTNDGISVIGIDRYYMASSSSEGITVDSKGWEPEPQKTNPISRYHWSYEVVNYSSGPPVPTKPAIIGVYGKDGKEGIDAVTVALSSEAHTFAGTETKAIASSLSIDISAFKGNQRISTSIGTVTGGISGQIDYSESGRGTTSNKLVINVTNKLDKSHGTLSIPIVADGRTFNKVFSWSVAFKGKIGDKGISITKVDVEYYLSTSDTSLAGGSWSTTAPAWKDGRFMWSKTVTTYTSGSPTESKPVCITGAKGSTGGTGATGRGVSSIVEQFYLSDSKDTQTGDSWSNTTPTWSPGKYVWTRSLITYTTGTPATSTTEPLVSSEWEAINELEIGGRNLLRNSGTPTAREASYSKGVWWATEPIEEGEIVTLSAKIYTGSYRHVIAINNQTGARRIVTEENTVSAGTKIYSWTIKWSNFNTVGDYADPDNPGVRVFIRPPDSPNTSSVEWIKLERGNKATDWSPAPEDIQSQINKSVKSTDVEYYLSTSSTGLSGGKWQTTAPPWGNDKYMWSRTKVVLNDGTPIYNPSETGTNITGAKGSTGGTGRGVSSIVEQFYLSDSKTVEPPTSGWLANPPTWSTGKYIWTRSLITYTTGTPTTSTTKPLVSSEWEAVNEIEVGGRNLAHKGVLAGFSSGYTRSGDIFTMSGKNAGIRIEPATFEANTSYVMSFKFRKISGTVNNMAGHAEGFGIRKVLIDGINTGTSWAGGGSNPVPNDTDIHTVEVHLYLTDNSQTGLYIQPNRATYTNAYSLELWDLKLEKGNKATDWTPAPEDVQSQIDNKAESGSFNQLVQTVTTETERLDAIDTVVESTKNNFLITHTDEYVNKITTTESKASDLESRVVSVEETKENVDTFFQFDDAFTIGKSNAQTKLRMTNDEIQFLDGETKGTYITGNTMVSQNMQIQDKLNLPKHTFETEGDITVVKYIG